jgi:long-subunit acyl-CoA synthetase (AMP-forming)
MKNDDAPTLLHRFVHWERTQPDVVAFTQPQADGSVVEYTWAQVGDQARRVAAYLKSLDLPAGSSISIVGKNTAHWIIADLAIWMAGHLPVPLYPTLNADTARYIFEHCGTRVLFVGKLDGVTDGWNEIRTVLPSGVPVVALPIAPAIAHALPWESLLAGFAPLQDIHSPAPQDLATIVYTSGSTGTPKGVMHSFDAMLFYARGSGEFCATTTADRLLSYLPLAHVAERAFVECNWLCHGLHVYFSDSLETFARDLVRARPTLFISMPRLWTKFYTGVCAKLPPGVDVASMKRQILTQLGLQDVRIAFTGSAPLPAEIVAWYRGLGLELLDVYGMTEDFAWSHYSRPGQVRLGYVGTALPGVQRRIDETSGEILIKTPPRMMGYYRQPELTAQSMTPDGYFRTGDRGEVDEEGRLKITGRVKELFKTSKGKYVAPAPIENRLTHPKLDAVCVTGPGHPQPFALFLPSIDARRELADPAARSALVDELETLLDGVNARLEDHEKLSFAVVVRDAWTTDNGFLTPTLKIKRNVVEARYLPGAGTWSGLGRKVVLQEASK